MNTAAKAGVAVLTVAALALAGCGSPASYPKPTAANAAGRQGAVAPPPPGWSASRACNYLNAVQAHYGLNSLRGLTALSRVAANAHNVIGYDAGNLAAHWSRSLENRYEIPLANDCMRLTGTP
jgi:hypothetical protein